jgi:uncharacterized protein YegL
MTFAPRLPIYLLVDTSSASALKRAEQAIAIFINEMRCDPQALETAHLSVITFFEMLRRVSEDIVPQASLTCDVVSSFFKVISQR